MKTTNLILSTACIYLVISVISLEQTIREYERSSISSKECTKTVKEIQSRFTELLNENNKAWKQALIQGELNE